MPFHKAYEAAQDLASHGLTVHQAFTCEHCSVRNVMAEPGTFYTRGTCEACGKQTDIEANGCGYRVTIDMRGEVGS